MRHDQPTVHITAVVSFQVCLQEILVEIDEDNCLPETTRDVILDLYENLQELTPSLSSSPALAQLPRPNSHSSGPDEAPVPVADEKRETSADSAARGGPGYGSSSGEGSIIITGPDQSHEKAANSEEGSSAGIQRERCHRASTDGEGLAAVPNLHHLLQLIEAVRRNSCYLQLTMAQAASLLTFEAARVFSSVMPSEALLRKGISGVIKKYFEEVTCRLARDGEVTRACSGDVLYKELEIFLVNVLVIVFLNMHAYGCEVSARGGTQLDGSERNQ